MTRGIVAALPDGSGIYVTNNSSDAATNFGLRFAFCPNYKDCKNNIDETGTVNDIARNGTPRMFFVMLANGFFSGRDQARAAMISQCNGGQRKMCGALIQHDGWEIKDDYPW